jgi:hypothetical protein
MRIEHNEVHLCCYTLQQLEQPAQGMAKANKAAQLLLVQTAGAGCPKHRWMDPTGAAPLHLCASSGVSLMPLSMV